MPDNPNNNHEPSQPLRFKSETDRADALEELQNRMDAGEFVDGSELDRITNAEIVADGNTPPQPQPSLQPTQPQTGDSPLPSPASSEDLRSWQINEDMIPKDDYFDEESGRRRPFITHKKPEDLFKSYINAQKKLHHLEKQRLPLEHKAGYDAAKVEYDRKISELQSKISELQQKISSAPAPSPAPALAAPSVPDTSGGDLSQIMRDLESLDISNPDYDMTDHLSKTSKALASALKVITQQNQGMQQLRKEIQDSQNQVTSKFEEQRQADDRKRRQEEEKQRQQQIIESSFRRMDEFIQSDAGKKEVGFSGKFSFREMDREANKFRSDLAHYYTGKPLAQLTPEDRYAAEAAYLSKNPALLDRLSQAGISEPESYQEFLVADQIDLACNGWVRDPSTRRYQQRFDTVTRQPINFGDPRTAWNWVADQTGLRQQRELDIRRQSAQEALQASMRRDADITSMDINQHPGSGGEEITVDEAVKVLESIDPELAFAKAQRGDSQDWELLQKAQLRLQAAAPTAT